MEELTLALNSPIWKEHKIGDTYKIKGDKDIWKIAYYPIFECGKTGEVYTEPRTLVEKPIKDGTDFREVPMRYLSKIVNMQITE